MSPKGSFRAGGAETRRKTIAFAVAGAAIARSAIAQQPPDFEGRYIAAISDGDKRGPDDLAFIALPLVATEPTSRIVTSNSIFNPVFFRRA